MRREYPIEGRLEDWFFRAVEASNGVWRIEGADVWGRRVGRIGTDRDAELTACVADAATIVERVAEFDATTRLRPDERTLDGFTAAGEWDLPTQSRIEILVARYLEQVGSGQGGASQLFRDPADGRMWCLTYPHGEMRAGGPARLELITVSGARLGHALDGSSTSQRPDLELLRRQWRSAARELRVKFIAPFVLPLPNGKQHEFAGLLPHFGGERGMLIDIDHDRDATEEAARIGFGFTSMLPERRALPLDATSYIDCLIEWTWTAKGRTPPEWYPRGG